MFSDGFGVCVLSVAGVGVGLEFGSEPAKAVVASKGKPLVLACAAGGPSSEGTRVSWLVNGSPLVLSERVALLPNGSLAFRKVQNTWSSFIRRSETPSKRAVTLREEANHLRGSLLLSKFAEDFPRRRIENYTWLES